MFCYKHPELSFRSCAFLPLGQVVDECLAKVHGIAISASPEGYSNISQLYPQMREGTIRVHLHLVSDATGETIHSAARACLAQFEGVEAEEHNWTLVRTPSQVEKILINIADNPGIVMFTLVSDSLRRALQDGCRELQIPCIPVLAPVMAALGNHLGI